MVTETKQTAITIKKTRNYRPEKNSNGYNILIGLFMFENETKKKYAAKKEIKQSVKNGKDIADIQISGWAPMTTLIKYDLISSFKFSDEEKYSLTENGYKLANDCYIDLLKGKTEQIQPTLEIENSNDLKTLNFILNDMKINFKYSDVR